MLCQVYPYKALRSCDNNITLFNLRTHQVVDPRRMICHPACPLGFWEQPRLQLANHNLCFGKFFLKFPLRAGYYKLNLIGHGTDPFGGRIVHVHCKYFGCHNLRQFPSLLGSASNLSQKDTTPAWFAWCTPDIALRFRVLPHRSRCRCRSAPCSYQH